MCFFCWDGKVGANGNKTSQRKEACRDQVSFKDKREPEGKSAFKEKKEMSFIHL